MRQRSAMQYMAQPPGSLPGSNIVTSTTPDISESRDSTPTEIDDVAIAALEGGGCMSCRAAGGCICCPANAARIATHEKCCSYMPIKVRLKRWVGGEGAQGGGRSTTAAVRRTSSGGRFDALQFLGPSVFNRGSWNTPPPVETYSTRRVVNSRLKRAMRSLQNFGLS